MLTRCNGPECPACGCQDTEIDHTRRRWGSGTIERYRCKHCGKLFQPERWSARDSNGEDARSDPIERQETSPGGAVLYYPTRCPQCRSADTVVVTSRVPIRYHKCRACGFRFKSVEKGEPQ